MTLLAAHSCFNLSEGQILGEGSKDATEEERRAHFRSQVVVETLSRWQPTARNYMGRIQLPRPEFKFQGSGTILTPRWVLTAAHLFKTQTKWAPSNYRGQTVEIKSTVQEVRVVVEQLEKQHAEGYTRVVERVIKHRDYLRVPNKGDIALLHLRADLNNNFEAAVPPNVPEFSGLKCKMSGWGRKNDQAEESATLRWANATVVPHTPIIQKRISNHDTDLFFVGMKPQLPKRKKKKKTDNQQPKDQRAAIGQGDSGGGLLCQHKENTYLFGVARGTVIKDKMTDYPLYRLGKADLPTLFTSVHTNLDWIRKWRRFYDGRNRKRDEPLIQMAPP